MEISERDHVKDEVAAQSSEADTQLSLASLVSATQLLW